jgi:hypothetical protein
MQVMGSVAQIRNGKRVAFMLGTAYRPDHVSDENILVTEFSALVGLAGLILVFIPFFLQRLGDSRETLSTAATRTISVVIWVVGLSLIVPVAGATTALITLLDSCELAGLTNFLTFASIWLVFALAVLSMVMEGRWR